MFLFNKNPDGQRVIQSHELTQQIQSNPKVERTISTQMVMCDEKIEIHKDNDRMMCKLFETQFLCWRSYVRSNYSTLRKKFDGTINKWTDPDFPPDKKSIGTGSGSEKYFTDWRRIGDIVENASLFGKDIGPESVFQNGLENCYFISALAGLARFPVRIKKLFPYSDLNPNGIYVVVLFHEGVFKEIVIDDYIPTNNGRPIFASSRSGQVWMMLVEKAYAKMFGSYSSIVMGVPHEAYYALTGAPTFFYDLMKVTKSQKQDYWLKIVDSFQRDYCMDLGTPPNVNRTYMLQPSHSYSVIAVYEKPFRLLKLRNPRGNTQWIGRASFLDKQFWSHYSQHQKSIMGADSDWDGVFFMLWDDVVSYFSFFEICEVKNMANTYSIRRRFTIKNAEMFELETVSDGQFTISLVEDSQKGVENIPYEMNYNKSYMIISKKVSPELFDYQLVRAGENNRFAAHHQRFAGKNRLQPGKYVIYAKYNWKDQIDRQASIVVYSDSAFKLTTSSQSKHPLFIYKTFQNFSQEDIMNFWNSNEQFIFSKSSKLLKGGYGFYSARLHKDAKSKIAIEIDESEMNKQYLSLKKPYKGKGLIKIKLLPGESVVVVFRCKKYHYPENLEIPDPKISRLI